MQYCNVFPYLISPLFDVDTGVAQFVEARRHGNWWKLPSTLSLADVIG
jgi:hypothetical protein